MDELGRILARYLALPCLLALPAMNLSLGQELPMTSFTVSSAIISRYASTRVCCAMHNPHPAPRQAAFDLDLSPAAFITNFTLTVDGKVYTAEVMEKHRAKELYEAARKQGKTAAHVGTKEQEAQRFRVTATVAANGHVSFELRYEELLQRRLGTYRYAVAVRPRQVVAELRVELSITERAGIGDLRVLPFQPADARRGQAPPAARVEKGTHCARVAFAPTPQEQAAFSAAGLAGDFAVEYDVARRDVVGDVELHDGYFVHFFAPSGLPPIPKDIIFLIDVSGSMSGTKIKQTKAAMQSILRALRPHDRFNIVAFAEAARVWRDDGPVPATAPHVRSAARYVESLEADGWTDIDRALLAAAALLRRGAQEPRVPLLLLLTDGEPTAGVTDAARILSNARRALAPSAALLFGLAFGADADLALLRRLAAASGGTARRVPEEAGVALQLAGLFREIESPLLRRVELAYPGAAARRVAPGLFPAYFQGSELVLAGRLEPGAERLRVHVAGQGGEGELRAAAEVPAAAAEVPPGCPQRPAELLGAFARRLWAYVTIRELLRARLGANGTAARQKLDAEATELALLHRFVTPLTSLVVVTPGDGGPTPPPPVTGGLGVTAAGLGVTAAAPNGPAAATEATAGPPKGPATAAAAGQLGDVAGPGSTVPPWPPRLWVPPVPGGTGSPPRGPGDAVLLLQPAEAELLAPGAGGQEFVESLDPPPVYAVLTPKGLPDDENTADLTDAVDRASSSPTFFTFSASVDGDPHFVASVRGAPQPLCFTLDGRPGDVLQLLTDRRLGLRVHGHLVGAPPWPRAPSRPRTFLDALTLSAGAAAVAVTPRGIRVTGGGAPPVSLPFSSPARLRRPPLTLQVGRGGRLHLLLGPRLRFGVLRHRYGRPGALQRDHLGFYVRDGAGLSPKTGGLLGRLRGVRLAASGTPGTARLQRGEVGVTATLVAKRGPGGAPHPSCWLVPRPEVLALLGGPYGAFLAPPSVLG